MDALFHAEEYKRNLEEQLQSIKRMRNELWEDYRRAIKQGDSEKAQLLWEEIRKLERREEELRRTLKVLEIELRRAQNEFEYMGSVATMDRLNKVLRKSMILFDPEFRSDVEKIVRDFEETLAINGRARLPEPNGKSLVNGLTREHKLEREERQVPEEVIREAERLISSFEGRPEVVIVDGIADVDEIAEKIYNYLMKSGGKSIKVSVKKLAEALGVTENVVLRALERLEERGKIRVRRGHEKAGRFSTSLY